MRFVIDGVLYNTDTAKLVHETGFEAKPQLETLAWGSDRGDSVKPGYYRQSLWETPNGNFFYVYEYPHSPPKAHSFNEFTDLYRSFAEGYGENRREVDDIDCAIKWLERHDGAEVILNRWPGRLVAG